MPYLRYGSLECQSDCWVLPYGFHEIICCVHRFTVWPSHNLPLSRLLNPGLHFGHSRHACLSINSIVVIPDFARLHDVLEAPCLTLQICHLCTFLRVNRLSRSILVACCFAAALMRSGVVAGRRVDIGCLSMPANMVVITFGT